MGDTFLYTMLTLAKLKYRALGANVGRVEDRVFVLGGGTVNNRWKVQEYRIRDDTWRARPEMELPFALERTFVSRVDGKLTIFGGAVEEETEVHDAKAVLQFDEADGWKQIGKMPAKGSAGSVVPIVYSLFRLPECI